MTQDALVTYLITCGDASILLPGQEQEWAKWHKTAEKAGLAAQAADFLREFAQLDDKIKALQKTAKDSKKRFARMALG